MYMVITFKQMVQLMLIHAGVQLIVGLILVLPKVFGTIRRKKKNIEEDLAKAERELNDFVESRNEKRIIGFRSDTITNTNNGDKRS